MNMLKLIKIVNN